MTLASLKLVKSLVIAEKLKICVWEFPLTGHSLCDANFNGETFNSRLIYVSEGFW